MQSMAVNGYPYKLVNDEWIPDKDARREQISREVAEQKRKDELVFACRSRVLTDDEMREIATLGIDLFIRMNGGMSQSYNDLKCRMKNRLL